MKALVEQKIFRLQKKSHDNFGMPKNDAHDQTKQNTPIFQKMQGLYNHQF